MQIEIFKSLIFRKLKNFHILVGIGGIDNEESGRAHFVGGVFYWTMLLVAFWLPIHWYLEFHRMLAPTPLLFSDWIVWSSFVIKTITLCSLVKRKWLYLFSNWINLVIIIFACPLIWYFYPGLEDLKIIRLLFIVSILVSWIPVGYHFLSRNHVGSTLLTAIILTFLTGALISVFEPGIKSPLLGIWWAWETVTTSTYGDVIPVTWAGRMVAIFLMVMGGVLFSLLTANFASFLIKHSKYRHVDHQEKILNSLAELESKIAKIERVLGKLAANSVCNRDTDED